MHAILDIDDVTSMTIHDNHSLNKTLRNGTQLKPDVHYALEGGETLTLGEIVMKFELVTQEEREERERMQGGTDNDATTEESAQVSVAETVTGESADFSV